MRLALPHDRLQAAGFTEDESAKLEAEFLKSSPVRQELFIKGFDQALALTKTAGL